MLLGLAFSTGKLGVSRDDAEAYKWFRKSAERGNLGAQFAVGDMHEDVQEYGEAVKWYRRAAEAGYGGGEFALGRMYESGRGAPQDYVLAYKWLNLSAAAGYDDVGRTWHLARRFDGAVIA